MTTPTVERTTRQEFDSGFNPTIATQGSPVPAQQASYPAVAQPVKATTGPVSPARGGLGVRLLALAGRVMGSIYNKLAGPAVTDRARRNQALRIEQDQWYRHI